MDQKKDSSSIALRFFVVFGIWLISVAFIGVPLALLIASFVHPDEPSDQVIWIILAFIVVPCTLAGPLLLSGFDDRHWWQRWNGCGKIDEVERARLLPPWNEVCERTGMDPHAYRLVMTSQPTVNAFATGDSMVNSGHGMLDSLGDPELKAIMAHKLGITTSAKSGSSRSTGGTAGRNCAQLLDRADCDSDRNRQGGLWVCRLPGPAEAVVP